MLSLSHFGHLEDGPRGAQEAPGSLQERPKRLQEASKSAPGGSKRASRDPKSRSRGLKSLENHTKRLQKTRTTLIIQTKHMEQLQRRPAKMPCYRMLNCKYIESIKLAYPAMKQSYVISTTTRKSTKGMSSETAHKCLKDSPGGGVPLWGKAIRRPERKWRSSRRVRLGKAIGFETQSPNHVAKRF